MTEAQQDFVPSSAYAALMTPAAASIAAGAVLVRMQLNAFEAWREMMRAPFVVFPVFEPGRMQAATEAVLASGGKLPKRDGQPEKSEEAIDEEIDESFPASDPPSHNPGKANPPTDDERDED